MQRDSVENIFVRSWSLLTRNPIIIVPGLVVGLIVGVVQGLIAPHPHFSADTDSATMMLGVGALAARAAVGVALGLLAFVVTQAYTTGMAGAAWQTGRTVLADGSAAFREDAGRLIAAMVLVALLLIVVTTLTFGIGWFIVLFFALYMVPAVVLDNYGAIRALRYSATIALKRVASTIIIVVMLFAIGLVVGFVVVPLAFIPFLGPIVSAIVSQAVTAFATLVVVGEYLSARRAPDVISAGPLA